MSTASLCLWLMIAAGVLHAQLPDPHAVQPERPTVATHAGTVAPGWAEIESGVEFDSPGSQWRDFSVPTVLKIGVAPRVQLGVFAPVVRPAQHGGLGDAGFGIKWRLLDAAPLLGDFAVLPSVKFSTGDVARGTGTGTTDASLLLISSHTFRGVAMDANAGYTRRSGDGAASPRHATQWTLSFGGPARGRLGWVAECFGYPGTGGPSGAPPTASLLAGPTFLAHPWIALDAGVIRSIAGPVAKAVYAGVTYNAGRVH